VKRSLLTGLVLAISVSAAYVLRGFAQDFPPALVVTEPVKTMDFHEQLTLVGRSEARATSRIVARVSGPVVAIDAREGVWVKKDAALVTVDSQRIALSLTAKEAEAAQAKADAELAQKEYARVKDLFGQEILSERVLDEAEAAVTRTSERYKQLEAERDQLKIDVYNCVIRAPYAGHTVHKLVNIGEWVSAGTPVYEMVDLAVVKITVDLPERHFGQVEMGSPVSILVSSDESSPLVGKVTGIAPQASQTTHTFPVMISVTNREGRLGGGMLVRAIVSLRSRFSSLAVSKDAIIRQGDQTLVYTVVDGKAAPIYVMTSASNGTMVAVRGEGLADGMPVVVRGNERIFPGSPVQTPDAAPPKQGQASGQTSG
jgi:RND family efflux transporter MFP subunit